MASVEYIIKRLQVNMKECKLNTVYGKSKYMCCETLIDLFRNESKKKVVDYAIELAQKMMHENMYEKNTDKIQFRKGIVDACMVVLWANNMRIEARKTSSPKKIRR